MNGNPAPLLRMDGVLNGIMAIAVGEGRGGGDGITGPYYVRNPAKLTRVESETPLSRRCSSPSPTYRARSATRPGRR
ncbi:hypothetical protein [Actinomadura harenae]|uniref:Uncharacterized protein n=1 Tax=Actinomadura harenae TaxID=2483351 RepID=A0A3M2LNJ9_9ACTN|nr:hypothetical protein [Actinomadura harenae]RMI38999.1 hypothetical protein EBO15_31035 [Actinomadura harenae]